MKKLIALIVLFATPAFAQSPATLSFTTPNQYTDGSVLPASAITGYDVQCSGWTPTGGARSTCTQFAAAVLAANATGGVLTGTIPGVGGQACFQIRTKTTPAVSAWSNEACKTFSPLVPNPPGNVTVAVVIGINMAPVYKYTIANKRSTEPAGFILIGKPCAGNVLFAYRGESFRQVDRAEVSFWQTVPSERIAAPCKAGA